MPADSAAVYKLAPELFVALEALLDDEETPSAFEVAKRRAEYLIYLGRGGVR